MTKFIIFNTIFPKITLQSAIRPILHPTQIPNDIDIHSLRSLRRSREQKGQQRPEMILKEESVSGTECRETRDTTVQHFLPFTDVRILI